MSAGLILNGLSYGSLLMLISSGLAMTYGLRGVMNFAHGGIFAIGAYVTYEVVAHTGSFWLGVATALIVTSLIGLVLELGLFAPMQDREHLDVGLITFGLALVIIWAISRLWGDDTLSVAPPAGLDESVTIFGTSYPTYRLCLIGISILVAVALGLWLNRTKSGLQVRAVSHDPQTSAMVGVKIDRLALLVVALGSGLAGLAGALATPYLSVFPDMGQNIVVIALIVVVIGGLGSIGGAMLAGMVLGTLETVGIAWIPGQSVLIPYAALMLTLLLRPRGLAGKRIG